MSYQFYKKWHFKLLISAWVVTIGAWIINGLGLGILAIFIAFIVLGLGIIGLVGLIKEASKQ